LGVPDVIHHDGAHHVGGIGEELLVALHRDLAGLDEPQVGLVDQRRRIEHDCVARTPDALVSQGTQFRVQDAIQLVNGGAVAAGRRREDLR
jgi:hypothetical protein